MWSDRDKERPLPDWELRRLVQVIGHAVADGTEGRRRRTSMGVGVWSESRDQRSPGGERARAQ